METKSQEQEKATDDGGKGKRQSPSFEIDDYEEFRPQRRRKRRVPDFSDDSYSQSSDDILSTLRNKNKSVEVPLTPSVRYDFEKRYVEKMLEGICEPTIWKVKCTDGLERVSAVLLMQKYGKLEAKLPIQSACALDHVNGFIFVEAEKQIDVYEACKDLPYFYLSSVSRSIGMSGSMLTRVENFKSNLAQMIKIHDGSKLLPPSSDDLHGEEKHLFMSYERPEEHGVAEHLCAMLSLWREIDGDVSDYVAARKTIETIPADWKNRAEQLYNKQVVYTSTADAPVLNFPRYIADMLYWWASGCIHD